MRMFRRRLLAGAVLVAAAALAPPAAGDRVYHSEHLDLTPTGAAPLRSGFVENIKAQGPQVYAHEVFVLNGARPNATYTVTRHFFFKDPACAGGAFASDLAQLQTNGTGNARGDVFVAPEDVAGFEGAHGVRWSVRDSSGTIAYQTACTQVTLD